MRGRGITNLRKCVREKFYIARKKERYAIRKTSEVKEYIILGYDAVV